MGFRSGAYAKVWEIAPKSETLTQLRISISRKDKKTDTYEQDFSGFVAVVGSMAQNASSLAEGARIKLGDVDVSQKYDKEKKVTYTNFKVFSYEDADGEAAAEPAKKQKKEEAPEIDDFEIYESDEDLPF